MTPTAPATSSTVPATAPPITAPSASEARSLSKVLLCSEMLCVGVGGTVVTAAENVVDVESRAVEGVVVGVVIVVAEVVVKGSVQFVPVLYFIPIHNFNPSASLKLLLSII